MTQRPEEEPDWDAVVPYTGPPSSRPAPGWAPPVYAPPPAPYGLPYAPPTGWAWAPPRPVRPQRPGASIAAAVLAFVLAALTLFGTVYAMAFSALLAVSRRSAGGLGPWIALVQLGVVGLLVAGGLLVLGGRRAWLFVAAGAEVALSVYWVVVLDAAALPGLGDGVLTVPVVFVVLAAASAGLACTPAARAWERSQAARRAGAASRG
ncbi:hypothetical protein [Modestobacter lapidis]|nr:hypothetical protein [Modestobacter lapidis]